MTINDLEPAPPTGPGTDDDANERSIADHAGDPGPTHRAPLLAVCGLCGGAGVSLLSYLLARFLTAADRGHVVLADTGGPTGGLAAHADTDAQHSLLDAADLVSRGLPWSEPLYTVDRATARGSQLRVIATGPRLLPAGSPRATRQLLAGVRTDATHAAVVVDCGVPQRGPDRLVLRAASHVAWVVPTAPSAATRGLRVLAAVPPLGGRELLVVRGDDGASTAPMRTLLTAAEQRRAALVLMPELSRPERTKRALAEAAVALQAIAGALGR